MTDILSAQALQLNKQSINEANGAVTLELKQYFVFQSKSSKTPTYVYQLDTQRASILLCFYREVLNARNLYYYNYTIDLV